MKQSRAIFIFSILIILAVNAHGQRWKKYADSATNYNKQKNQDRSIELYIRAAEELKKDSSLSNTYAGICDSLANLYMTKGQYGHAEDFFESAKQIRKKLSGSASKIYAASCNDIGRLHVILGQAEIAENDLEEARKIMENLGLKNDAEYARSCNYLANLYRNTAKYEKAEPLYMEAKAIKEKLQGKEYPGYGNMDLNLGMLYRLMGQYKKAEPFCIAAKQIMEKTVGRDHPDYTFSCSNLADLYVDMGIYLKAAPLYAEVIERKEQDGVRDDADYISACESLGNLYTSMGLYDKSELLLTRVKTIRERLIGKESTEYATSCHNLAIVYLDKGQYEKAELLFNEAKKIYESNAEEEPAYVNNCLSIGILYKLMGRFDQAEPLYLKSLQIQEKIVGKEHLDYALCSWSTGGLYYSMGQYEKAESFYEQARQIIERVDGREHPHYAGIISDLASIYLANGQYEKAKILFLDSKAIRERTLGKDNVDYATSCSNLGFAYVYLEDYKKAEPFIKEAKLIWGKQLGTSHPYYAFACNQLANLYKFMGDYQKALPLYVESRKILRQTLGSEHPEYASSCRNIASTYWVLKDYEKANEYFLEAFESQNAELRKVFRFTNESEKQSYLNKVANLERYILSFQSSVNAGKEQHFAYDISLSGRNLTLSSFQQLHKAIDNTKDTSGKRKYNDWIDIRKQLAFWYAKPIADRAGYVKDLEDRANLLEKELSGLSADFENEQLKNAIDWKAIQNNLRPNEAAIEFAAFQYYDGVFFTDSAYYVALVLRKDKPGPELISLFEQRGLDSLLSYKKTSPGERKVNLLYTWRDSAMTPGKSSLYNAIWAPLQKELAGIQTIYFAPAGDLYKIAFAALPIDSNQVLSDRYRLVQLNSTNSVLDKRMVTITPKDKITLFGGVQYDVDSVSMKMATAQFSANDIASRGLPDELSRGGFSGFNYLSQSELEVNTIGILAREKNYPVKISSGVTASEESVKALSGTNSPVILHLATHGFFFPNPSNAKKQEPEAGAAVFQQSEDPLMRSGLALAGANNAWKGKAVPGIEDGILTAYEVSNMYLPNTELVVLSACETGLGDIQGSEGVFGLQRAFKMAGVQNLVMSLWKVDDLASSEFMQEFYKNLFEKQTIDDAFHNAQTILKNKYRNDPYKWAAWILVR